LPEFNVFGFNYRLTDIQAAVAVVQLGRLDGFIEERAALADHYDARLKSLPWARAPMRPPHSRHALQAYVALVDESRAPATRNEMLTHLQMRGIGGRPGTHSVVGLEAYRQSYRTDPAAFPIATYLEGRTLALPMHNHMTMADADRVVDALEEIV
jgi:perosamine synthetase